MSLKKSTEEYIKQVSEIHNRKYDYSLVKYDGREKDILVICPKHGVFVQKAKNHLRGHGCPLCANEITSLKCKKSLEQFISEAKMIHGDKYDYSLFNYVNAHTKNEIICPYHGSFVMSPNDHLNGKGCPKCKDSHLERELRRILSIRDIYFEEQKRFDWLGRQSLDFYFPQHGIAIECQGKQHFGKGGWVKNCDFNHIFERDKVKYFKCLENNINIVYFVQNDDYKDNDFYNDKIVVKNIEEYVDKNLISC